MTRIVSLALTVLLILCGTAPPVPAQPPPGGVDLTQLPLNEAFFPFLEGVLVTELNKRVAEAEKWEVRLSRTGNDLKVGRIAQIDVKGLNIRLRDGLAIDEASLMIKNMKFDLKEQAILEVGDSLFTGKIQADAVRRFALKHAKDKVQNLEIVFRDGQMEVWGEVDPGGIGFALPVKVRGVPVLHDNVIDFDADEVSVATLKLPKSLVRVLEKQVNPIADLKGLKIPAKITKVAIEGARLVAEAKLDFSGGPPLLGKKRAKAAAELVEPKVGEGGTGQVTVSPVTPPPTGPRRPGDRRREKFKPGDPPPPR